MKRTEKLLDLFGFNNENGGYFSGQMQGILRRDIDQYIVKYILAKILEELK